MRISTAYANQSSLQRLQDTQSRMNELTYQISTGKKSDDLVKMASDANQLLNLKDQVNNSEIYVNNIDSASSRLKATESALQNMNDLIAEAASLWTLARNENSPETRATMAPKAEGLLNSFYSTFNTQFDGRYVFSGQAGDQPPVTGSPTASAYAGNPPSTDYFNGDSKKMQTITDAGTTTAYGVTGDDSAFARMKAGMEALWYGLANNSEADIDGAIELLQNAQEDMSDLVGEVGGQLNGLTLQKERHENTQVYLNERVGDIENVDVAEAMTEFTQEQAVMEASMMVMTSLSRLTLLDFMR